MPPPQAITIARQKGLDLVEISPTAVPPVCRIMDFGKYQYQEQKRAREAKKHQKIIEVKEIKFRPKVDEHDYQFKKKHIERFLAEGDKVKATVFFRGREMAHPEIGRRILERLIGELSEVALAESGPRQEGNQMHTILTGKSDKSGRRPCSSARRRRGTAACSVNDGCHSHPGGRGAPGRLGGSTAGTRRKLEDAEAQDSSRRRQALQEDRHRQVPPEQRLQAAHPDEQDDQGEARPARRQAGDPGRRGEAGADAAVQIGTTHAGSGLRASCG